MTFYYDKIIEILINLLTLMNWLHLKPLLHRLHVRI